MDIEDNRGHHGLAFHVAVMKFICFCGLSAGIPFGLWHLFRGNPMVFLTLIPAMGVQAMALYLLYRDGFNRNAALMVAIVQIAGAVFYVHLVGVIASYWLFASSVANFYLLSWRRALVINLTCCVVVAWLIRDESGFVLRFVINYLLVNLFLFVYTHELEKKTTEVAHLLYRDPLTGSGNRLALDAALAHVRRLKERYDTPVTLLMLDLDHFKQVNDNHGHTAGDRLLKDFTRDVTERLRATDSLYRFGGEEFMIIAENTRLDEAEVMAEAIRERVAATPYPPTDGVTISIGLAELRPDESSDSWLNRTDRALYQAKYEGRNRIAIANGDRPSDKSRAAASPANG